MYIACLAFGALAGVLFSDRRALSAAIVASGVLLFIAIAGRMSLIWLATSLICFQSALFVAGLVSDHVRSMLKKRVAEPPRRGIR